MVTYANHKTTSGLLELVSTSSTRYFRKKKMDDTRATKYIGFTVEGGRCLVSESVFEEHVKTDESVCIVFECIASSWEDANQRWHDFNGWGTYIPMEE